MTELSKINLEKLKNVNTILLDLKNNHNKKMTTSEKNNVLRKVDIIKDREYILSVLKKSETEESYTFEESYKYGMDYISKL